MLKFCLMLGFATSTAAVYWGNVCRNGWEQYGNSCYLFKRTDESWSEAMKHCEVLGAVLVEINNAAENAFIKQAIQNHHITGTRYWTGGIDTEIEGSWRWASSDTAITYFDWSPSEPNNVGSNEDCLEYYENLHWNDRPCHTLQGFICEHILEQ